MKKRRNGSLSKEKTTSFSSLLDEQKQTSMKDAAGMEIATVQNLQYDLKTIEVATNCFSPKNTIGKGGFGLVYKRARFKQSINRINQESSRSQKGSKHKSTKGIPSQSIHKGLKGFLNQGSTKGIVEHKGF
ncbi:gnk2-like domain-containing protein [Artemisia annua]|uniref:Gnk2-like domain-containing protein n=1 Tax=Artemisia annua TaxID=35608 RepID=A0A2U1KFY9_ARTAN|nr:gnk2-like domain-containing protein [Artemisia annua]